MAKKREPSAQWKEDPDEHDFPAANDYLSLLLPEEHASAIVAQLRSAPTVRRKAKDLLRASELPLLPDVDPEVAKDIRRVVKGEALSPVLVVRGRVKHGVRLVVADGYHRICASYHLTENTDIPCRIAELLPANNGETAPTSTSSGLLPRDEGETAPTATSEPVPPSDGETAPASGTVEHA